MTSADVEALRAFLESWSRDGPWTPETWRREGLDVSIYHPHVTYEDANLPDHAGEPYRGLEGIVRGFQDGKVIHWRSYLDREQALRAVGLAE
jgi:hypothetical protein